MSKEENKLMPNNSDRDWVEDFTHENGNYCNKCIECTLYFYGHKRRVICKKCSTPNWEELSKRKTPEDTKDNKAWAGAWLEGEMVGYAKCMVEKFLPLEKESKEVRDKVIQECIKVIVTCAGFESNSIAASRLIAASKELEKLKTP